MRSVILLLPVLAATSASAQTAIDLESRVESVTVYADRARVTRGARVQLPRETVVLALPELPGWIDEGSVRVALEPSDAGQIAGVQIRRTFLARPSDDDFRAAENAVQEISDQIAVVDDEARILDKEAAHVDSLRAFSIDKLPHEAMTRPIEISELERSVAFVAESLRRIAAARRDLQAQRRQLEPELAVRQRRLAELQQRAQLEQRTILVTVDGAAPREASLAVTYMIPGATWEPGHELRTDPSSSDVALASLAFVRQTTGEDWTGAAISLSTQRSDQTLKIPEIEALRLGGGRSLSRLLGTTPDTFGTAIQSYAKQNAAFFDVINESVELQQAYRENQGAQLDSARRATEVFQRLEKRGTTAHFRAVGSQTVPSDGSRVRLPIGAVRLTADQQTIAAPEASLNAIRILDLANGGSQPLLPGRVALYVGGAFLGFTDIDFVSPGEAFELFLGVADQLKLSRVLDRKSSALSRRGERTKMSVAFLLKTENLSGDIERILLRDRIPVSQTDQIRVTGVKITPEVQPDAGGLLTWSVTLGPNETRSYRVEYTVEYPTGLPASAGRLHEELKRQLLDLESEMVG